MVVSDTDILPAPEVNPDRIAGQIERITYSDDQSGFTIAQVRVSGRPGLVTVVGSLMAPVPGEVLQMQGEWTQHPRFGEQFKVVHYQTQVPATVSGIKKYLGSGMVRGLGPKIAERIVDLFGKATLDILDSDSQRLTEVAGIGIKRAAMIQTAWAEQKEIRGVMLFLQSHGVSCAYAIKIFKQYGDRCLAVVRENPFRLATDIFGIGFVTADRIAEKLGFEKDAPVRIEAGILYVLHQLADDGHVYYPETQLMAKTAEILRTEFVSLVGALEVLGKRDQIVVETLPDGSRAVYLAKFHLCETRIAQRLRTLIGTPRQVSLVDVADDLAWVQGHLSIRLADMQVQAVKSALESKVMVITGGPGTGKTTIINAILKIASRRNASVRLAAPTGRAAKRMSEATGHEAKTIHRLLAFSMARGGFQKTENNPLSCELLIIDEASMIDILLMHHLLKAVPPSATLILVGDVNQLPSVGPGSVLKDIIDSQAVVTVRLNKIFRQAERSRIIINAHRINSGKMPVTDNATDGDFFFIQRETPEDALSTICTIVGERLPRLGFDPFNDIQVLTPMHRGLLGAGNLNRQLQEVLNSGEDHVVRGDRRFRLHDKVMQIRNNYDKDVFNGDIGRITAITADLQQLIVDFDDRAVVYEFSDLDEIVLAYAVSVHKAQGSEYPAVVMPVMTQHYVLLQRNLIYTAVTRGRRMVVLVGTRRALAIGVNTLKTQKRFTRLDERLRPCDR
ncbi:ATP-dependent RecD-like DNA helicase [Desulfosarcina sp.]|uniref:SF1B family DNA helicase RecD2 n=1 Tax=Desulfosarcina sp. TaxID=2027861 RepID=UPI0039708A51